MTVYVCTAGTSIADPQDRENPRSIEERIAAKLSRLKARHGEDIRELLAAACAETSALARADIGPGDRIVLIASDTPDGLAAAGAVAALVADAAGAAATVRSVAGLQVANAQGFRQQGIVNLIGIVMAEVERARKAGERVVFNVTGGFKGVVPYLTVLGMLEEIDVLYVFDMSDALITLPPLPLRFDHDRIGFAVPALQVLKSEQLMKEEAFRALLPGRGYGDDPVHERLVESVDGMVVLSGAGELALRGLGVEAVTAGRILLHRRARQSGLLDNHLVQRGLSRIRDPRWRSIPDHCATHPNTDMLICKLRGHSAPRLFYTVEDGDIRIADILPHGPDYDPDFLRGKRKLWRRDYTDAQFEPIEAGTAPEPEDWYGAALADFVRDVDAERAGLAAELARAREEAAELRADLRRAEARLGEAGDRLRLVLAAAGFAAERHRRQRRKDAEATPYVNHLIAVAGLLAEAGVTDADVLAAAFLHDAIEDAGVSGEEIAGRFGEAVRDLVEAVSDDKSLPKEERKRLQIAHAADAAPGARLIKLADKIANLGDLTHSPPADWPEARRRAYFLWARDVADALRGGGTAAHGRLEEAFDAAFARGWQRLSAADG